MPDTNEVITEVITAIMSGDLDDGLGRIQTAITNRNVAQLKPGARARLANIKPKYLNGVTGTIIDGTRGVFTFEIDPERRAGLERFCGSDGRMRRVKASLLEPIS